MNTVIPVILLTNAVFLRLFGATGDSIDSDDWHRIVLPVASTDITQRIKKFRTKAVTVVLKDASGKPLETGKKIQIEMIRHSFLFGQLIIYPAVFEGDSALQKKYRTYLTQLFNFATAQGYWDLYERERDKPLEKKLRQLTEWCVHNNIRLKVHPLIWHKGIPVWAKYLPQTQFQSALKKRIIDLVGCFSKSIDMWEVFNEPLYAPTFTDNPLSTWVNDIGVVEAVRRSLSWARSANPKAFLIVNDFNTSTAYDDLLASLIKQRQAPDAMGIQAHFHKGVPPDTAIWEYLERVKKLNISVHVTELSINSGKLMDANDNNWNAYRPHWNTTQAGEQYQVKEALRFYRLLFSHPSVEAITWWGLQDPGYFAPTGLLRKDMSPKPAYYALMKLIHDEWWTRETGQTNAYGCFSFRGFFGHYQLTVGGKSMEFDLKKDMADSIDIKVN